MMNRALTKEQKEYRENLLKKGRRKKYFKETHEFPPYSFWSPWQTACWYLKNCHWWISELTEEGNGFPINKEHTLKVLSSIENHCKTMRHLLNT